MLGIKNIVSAGVRNPHIVHHLEGTAARMGTRAVSSSSIKSKEMKLTYVNLQKLEEAEKEARINKHKWPGAEKELDEYRREIEGTLYEEMECECLRMAKKREHYKVELNTQQQLLRKTYCPDGIKSQLGGIGDSINVLDQRIEENQKGPCKNRCATIEN